MLPLSIHYHKTDITIRHALPCWQNYTQMSSASSVVQSADPIHGPVRSTLVVRLAFILMSSSTKTVFTMISERQIHSGKPLRKPVSSGIEDASLKRGRPLHRFGRVSLGFEAPLVVHVHCDLLPQWVQAASFGCSPKCLPLTTWTCKASCLQQVIYTTYMTWHHPL